MKAKKEIRLVPTPHISIYDEIERKQMERREIVVTGPIDADIAHIIGVKLRYLAAVNKTPVTIYMNTPGGSVVDGLAVYDALTWAKSEGMKVNIVATGACMSMGAVVMQAAHKRRATSNAVFLLHELSMVNIGSLGQLKDQHNEALRLQTLLNGIITKRSGLSDAELQRLVARKNLYLSAKEARKYGIIDEVV